MKKLKWIICSNCEGDGKVENPTFSNGFTSSEWHSMAVDEQDAYLSGDYDIPCCDCHGLGRVLVPNVAAMSFSEKRQLVIERRVSRENAIADAQLYAEWAAERTLC